MQGQGSSVGSLPETLGFDHGSTSGDPVIEPQICWNSIRNGSQNGSYITDTNTVNQEGSNLSGWCIGEPSSSQQVHNNNRKVEHDWLSSINDCIGSNPILEDRQILNNNVRDLSDSTPQAEDHNMNSGFEGSIIIDDIPIPNSDSLQSFVEENEGHRLNCKRKSLEGQSSASGSSSYFRYEDYANHSPNNGLIISEVNPRHGLTVGGVVSEIRPNVAAQSADSSRHNLRLRINASSNPQDSEIPNNNNMFSVPHNHLLRFNPINDVEPAVPPPLPVPAPAIVAAETLIPLVELGPRRNLSSSRWNRGSSSRSNGFLDSSAEEERNLRIAQHNIAENQIFAPLTQTVIDWSFSTGASSSRGANHLPAAVAPSWAPQHRHVYHYPRRLRELVYRSLLASGSGGQNGNFAVPVSSSQEMSTPSGGRVPHSRAAMWMDRQQPEVTFGNLYQLRTLSAGGDGRDRLLSEQLRNVLDLMRRGERLRFEDVMILDQSVFFGMATDVHDRHGGMRLDVDNMSYEELLALEERIGNVNTGLSEDTILSRLKLTKYVPLTTALVDPIPCCVCQEEYNDGDDLGTLDCGHDFHSECIKRWLTHKNLCPICKTTALITSK